MSRSDWGLLPGQKRSTEPKIRGKSVYCFNCDLYANQSSLFCHLEVQIWLSKVIQLYLLMFWTFCDVLVGLWPHLGWENWKRYHKFTNSDLFMSGRKEDLLAWAKQKEEWPVFLSKHYLISSTYACKRDRCNAALNDASTHLYISSLSPFPSSPCPLWVVRFSNNLTETEGYWV